jgi:dihydroorotate dehydrogenase
MYSFLRPLLFKLHQETAHQLTLQLLRLSSIQPINLLVRAIFSVPEKPVDAFGLHFSNPVGLAAGYDKDGIAWRGLAEIGFGHIEIGTVTPHPQPGNPKPRIFRLVEDRAVINRMGFPGQGATYVAGKLSGRSDSLKQKDKTRSSKRILGQNSSRIVSSTGEYVEQHDISSRSSSKKKRRVILGVNLGINKDTQLENAVGDYITLVRKFSSLADYLAINVSSPNTAGLRRLQNRQRLEGLLETIGKERLPIMDGEKNPLPIMVKLAPDLSEQELDDALEAILQTGMDGVIATNTTLGRTGLRSKQKEEDGGLSGEPLKGRSEAVLHSCVKKLAGRLPIISVGGIMSPEDAQGRLDAGATLVQVYTGLVYAGPGLVKRIIQGL